MQNSASRPKTQENWFRLSGRKRGVWPKKPNGDTILIDGPPGIGCSVIASITGASAVVMVTEPSMSGEHDLMRTLELARHFKVPAFVCVNKWDICPEMADADREQAEAAGAIVLGRIRYDSGVTEAQKQAKAVIETGALCASDIEDIWTNLQHHIGKETST